MERIDKIKINGKEYSINGESTYVSNNHVTAYGAKGDGSADDTESFVTALAENRKVYVPGGTYKLTSGIVIRDNCELELAQDAVLNFTPVTGNCITLNMSSSLKGNHATIKVPYEFSGNVIYASSTTTENTSAIPPFTRWDPQWKSGRYITDLNICKADSRGFHYSVNGECSGTAVYISADGDATSTFMWGVHYSGLRIAGAFSYGIRAVNFNDGWNHEMRVDAFIDACEIGVSLENCNNAYISAIVQPRRAYNTAGVYSPYAKHGIVLINSRNTDLSGSRVWDWNENNSLWTNGGEYQHIALYGNCSGMILNDFLYYEQSRDIRDLIYTDTPSNLEKMNILQEPFTRWFKPKDGVPYFSDGFTEKRLMTEEDLDAYFDTDIVKGYTDVLSTATDTDGSIFKDKGYGYGLVNIDGSYTDGGQYKISTGFIPIKQGQTLYADGLSFEHGDNYSRVVLYNEKQEYVTHINRGLLIAGDHYYAKYAETPNGFSMRIAGNASDNVSYVRFVFHATDVSNRPLMAIDEEIKVTYEGFLADSVKVKAENVIGDVMISSSTANSTKKFKITVDDSGTLTATEVT